MAMGFSGKRQTVRLTGLLSGTAVGVLLLGLIGGTVHWWSADGAVLSQALRYSILVSLVALAPALLLSSGRCLFHRPRPEGFAAALLLLLLTDYLTRPFSFFIGPSIRGPILLFALLAGLLGPRWFSAPRLAAILVICSAMLLCTLTVQSGGTPLGTDDHPVTIFRLLLLRENFPFIPFFSPLWNAGFDARDFFATGILNVFIAFAPFWYLGDIPSVYTFVVGSILFLVLPISTVAGARIVGLSWRASFLAGLLALAPSSYWYRWALSYGAMGFVLSATLLPLNVALIGRILLDPAAVSLRTVLCTALTFSLMVCWSPAGIAVAPAFLIALWRIRLLVRSRNVLVLAGLLLALNLPWMVLFVHVSRVSTFVSLKQPADATAVNRDDGLHTTESTESSQPTLGANVVRASRHHLTSAGVMKAIRENSLKANPLLLFLIIPGLGLFSSRLLRVWYGGVISWLLVLGLIVAPLKPQLELERMVILALLAGLIPAGQALARLLTTAGRVRLILSAALLGCLFTGPFVTANILQNRSYEQYVFQSARARDLVAAIRQFGGEGRTAFSGFILHHLDRGHVAPLALWSGKPLVASSPFHNVWWYTELIPVSFRARREAGYEEYFDLMNTTAVVAHEKNWRDYFAARPDRYTKVWSAEGFQLYTRNVEAPSYFLKGSGAVLTQNSSSVRLRIDTPDAVVKFSYFPFLEVSGCSVGPYSVAPELTLVGLSGCTPGREVTLRGKSGFRRLLHDE